MKKTFFVLYMLFYLPIYSMDKNRKNLKSESVFDAIKKKDRGAIQKVVQQNPFCIGEVNDKGKMPLFLATKRGLSDIVELLLINNEIKVNLCNGKKRKTAVMKAAQLGYTNILILLLTHSSDIHLQDADGDTALSLALLNGKLNAADILLKKGADIYQKNKAQQTPLSIAKLEYPAFHAFMLRKANQKLRNV